MKVGRRGREASPVRISIMDKHVAIRRDCGRGRCGERGREKGLREDMRERGKSEDKGQEEGESQKDRGVKAEAP